MSSNSVCDHTCDKQIGLLLRGRPILSIIRMMTDRIGLHSVLLPLLTVCAMHLVPYTITYTEPTDVKGNMRAGSVKSLKDLHGQRA